MSIAELQNTTVSIMRGTTENQFGDQIDDNQVLYQGIPALLAETGHTVQDPSTPTPRTIREIVLHVPQYIGLLDTDRVMDQSTGDVYIVISVTTPPTIIGAPVDMTATLKRITANAA